MANPYSAVKVFYHREALDVLSTGQTQAPIYVRLKPTNFCNHHCAYCTYGSGNTLQKTRNRDAVVASDMIPWTKLCEIIDDMGSMGVKAITFSGGGEPLTYPHIIEAVQKVKEYGIDLSLISNGQLLKDDVAQEFYSAKWVRISFDSPNEAEYMELRDVSAHAFQQVCDNIRAFAKNKDANCVLGINFVISKANAHRVYEAASFLRKLGANNVKFAAMVDNQPHYHDGIKDDVIRQIHQAKNDLETDSFQIINNYENDWMDKNFQTQPFETCYICRLVTVIAADQKVYLCHTRAYDSHAEVGDLHEKNFKDVWFSDNTMERLRSLNPKQACRNFCVYQERNQLIQAYFDVDLRHVNFV